MRCFVMVLMVGLMILVAGSLAVEARIVCDGPFQVVKGHGSLATPYCEDEFLARVARQYGLRVKGSAVRANPHVKLDVCRLVGSDIRVSHICSDYRNNDGKGGR